MQNSMRNRFIIIFGLFIFVIIIVLQGWNYSRSMKQINNDESKQVDLIEQFITEKMDAQIRVARHSLLPIVNNPDVQEAFANEGRKELARLVDRSFVELEENGITQLQFHLPNATSFYRAHDPENFGDDLSSFRHTVVDANDNQESIEGLEEGVAGYGFRVVNPLIHNGNHVGTVEVGTNFGEDFLQQVQENIAGDYYLYSFQDDGQLIAGTNDEDKYVIDESTLEKVQSSGEMTYVYSDDKKQLITFVPFMDYTGEVKGFIKGVFSRAETVSLINGNTVSVIVTTVASIVLMMVITYFLINSITTPIRKVALTMDAVANKDLTIEKIEVRSKDEVGLLVDSLDKMTHNLRSILGTINVATEQVAASSEQLMASSEETSAASESVARSAQEATASTDAQLEEVHRVTTVVGALTDRITEIASESNELVHKTNDVTNSVHVGNESVEEIVAQMKEIQLAVERLGTVITNLYERTKEIDDIVNFITDISDQTNLLALNAAIEAARAGESGQGFAVVADEVRKLAEQSSDSTSQITNLIKSIQDETSQAVEMIADNTSKVNVGIEKTGDVNKAFGVIEHSILEVAQFSEGVVDAVESMNENSVAIVQAITFIEDAAESNTSLVHENSAASEEQMAALEQISASSEHLAKLAEDLQAEISTFKI